MGSKKKNKKQNSAKDKSNRKPKKGFTLSPTLSTILVSLGLAGLVFLIYSGVYDNSAHFDDAIWMKMPAVQGFNNFGDIFDINPFRWVVFSSFAFNYELFGHNLSGYYFFNVLIHAINTVLVYLFALLLLQTPVLKDSAISERKRLFALAVALIFAAHPLQTQAVAYIYQRLASFTAIFYFGSLAAYVKARISDKSSARIAYFATAGVLMLLGMFSKENAFTIPLSAFALEVFFLQKKFVVKPSIIGGIAAGLIVAGILAYSLYGPEKIFGSVQNYEEETVTSVGYFYAQMEVIARYVQLLFLPIGQNFDHNVPLPTSFFEFRVIAGAALHVLVLAFAGYMFNRSRSISFGIVWFYLTLSVESSVIPIADVMNEHRLYIPMFGFALAAADAIYRIVGAKRAYVSFGIVCFAAFILSILAAKRLEVWQNELTLWSDAYQKSPGKSRTVNVLANSYLKRKNYPEAIKLFSEGIALNPQYKNAFQNRGTAYFNTNQYQKAIDDYNSYFEIYKDNINIYINRANAYFKLGRYQKAIDDYTSYIESNANQAVISYDQAEIDRGKAGEKNPKPYLFYAYLYRGKNYLQLDEFDKAEADFDSALALRPESLAERIAIGADLAQHGKYDISLKYFNAAVESAPGNEDALKNRAIAYFQIGDYKSALADYQTLANIRPNSSVYARDLGVIYERLGKYGKAVEAYKRALELDSRDPQTHSYLGNVYKKMGEEKLARECYRNAQMIKQGKSSGVKIDRIGN